LDFFKKNLDSTKVLIYTNGIPLSERTEIIESVKRSEISETSTENNNKSKGDVIYLTKEERLFINSNLENQGDTNLWNELRIPGSMVISLDTITSIFKDLGKRWQYFNSHYGSCLVSFSIPIFFRKDQLCAFYYGVSGGELIGYGEFAIYKNQNGQWIKLISLYQWIS
jgi:hypothetical protein